MGWNPSQKAAIDFRENKDLLVAAAAGSGKTSVMVERVTQLILDGEAGIDEILAVTFTRAAASSMKEKIVKSLRERIAADIEKGDTTNIERLKSQLTLVNEADICTFDSFAQKIVRENFQSIDIDPGVGVCDPGKSEILKNQAMDEVLEENLKRSEPDFVKFMDSYADVRSLESIKEKIWDIYKKIMALPNPQGKLDELVEVLNLNLDAFVNSNAFKAIIEQTVRALPKAKEGVSKMEKLLLSDDVLKPVYEKLRPEFDDFRALDDLFEILFDLSDSDKVIGNDVEKILGQINELYSQVKAAGRSRRFQWTKTMGSACEVAFNLIKDEGRAIRDSYKKQYEDVVLTYFYQSLGDSLSEANELYLVAKSFCSLIKEFDNRFMEKKAELGSYDFTDFNHFALKALESNEIAEQYKSHYKYIFVDEYQDSNELQDELIRRISHGGNIFMVGDVKQSIYRFRQAEPQLFMNRYRAYKGNCEGYNPGTVIDLNANYRSRKTVVDAVNDVFEAVMEGYDEAARLNAGNPGEPDDNVKPQIKIINVEDNKTEESPVQLEVRAIAKIIKEKLEADDNLQLRDIAILMRSFKSYITAFKEIFEEEGIPLYVEEDKGYFDAVEVAIALNLLRTVDNIRQDLPLISVLYSPIFSFTCEELAKIRIEEGNRHTSFYNAFYNYAHTKTDVEEALFNKCLYAYDKLRAWQDESRTMPLPDFIWKLYRETGLYLFMGALPGGEQRQSNLRMLVNRAIAYSKEDSGIYNFLLEIDRTQERGINVPPAGTIGESANAVRLMTIHKSKGLEYPCVIIAGAHRELTKTRDDVFGLSFNKSIGIALQYVSSKERFRKETIIGKAIVKKNEEEARMEYIRLLYVAFTRAIKHLVITGCTQNNTEDMKHWKELAPLNPAKALTECKTFFDWIIPPLYDGISKGKIDFELLSPLAVDGDDRAELVTRNLFEDAKNIKISPQIEKRISYQYPYMADVLNKAKYSVTELNDEGKIKNIFLNVPENLDSVLTDEGLDAEDAAKRGTIYHKIMELVDFTDINACNPETILKDLLERGFICEKSETIIDSSKIKAFLNSNLAKRMSIAAGKGKLYKEAPFILQTEKDGRSVLVQGIIDCYFEEAGSDGKPVYILADYKTNKVNSKNEDTYNHFRDMYKKQIDLYAEAIERIKGINVTERYLILLDAGEAINI